MSDSLISPPDFKDRWTGEMGKLACNKCFGISQGTNQIPTPNINALTQESENVASTLRQVFSLEDLPNEAIDSIVSLSDLGDLCGLPSFEAECDNSNFLRGVGTTEVFTHKRETTKFVLDTQNSPSVYL